MNEQQFDIVVIGAGPAGLSAATQASNQGANVLLLDEQPSLGGQIYRRIEQQSDTQLELLGPEYQYGKRLVSNFRQSNAHYSPNAHVWSVNRKREIGYSNPDGTQIISARHIILASGAMERPVPFPGWTLPGVMNAGAGQILFKAHNVLPSETAVLAGSGPLLLLLAWQYLRAGVKIQALLDTTPSSNYISALRHLPRALMANRYLRKGLYYEWALRRAGIKIIRNVTDLCASGDDKVEKIEFKAKRQKQSLETQHLLVHFGIIPVNHLSQGAGCQHHWNEGQQCWCPVIDKWGQTSLEGISISGDGAGIAGAKSAEFAGNLVAIHALCELNILDQNKRDILAKPYQKRLNADKRIRPFLEAYFRIPHSTLTVNDDRTIVCRCEEVSAGEIRQAVSAGHTDSNQVKFITRCGMGPCQGRQCSPAVGQVIASTTGVSNEQAGNYRARPPHTPLTLEQLASLYPEERE